MKKMSPGRNFLSHKKAVITVEYGTYNEVVKQNAGRGMA